MRSLLVLAVILAGCAAPAPPTPPIAESGALALRSSAFQDHGAIPQAHGCDGAGTSPPLEVTGVPSGATVALIVGDPDAPLPQAPQQNFTHWIAWNAPAPNGTATFPAGAVAPGTVQGKNGGGGDGWTPPCPPPGSPPHRYVFTAIAVRGTLALAAGASRADLEGAIGASALGRATRTGCYMRAVQAPLPCQG